MTTLNFIMKYECNTCIFKYFKYVKELLLISVSLIWSDLLLCPISCEFPV